MRIGVNALYLIPGGVGGTEIYLRNVLAALALIDKSNEYFVFTNAETGPDLAPQAANFQTIPLGVHARNRPARLAAEQTVLPSRARRLALDRLWNPGFTAPVSASCPSVTVFHDLQHKRHPEHFSRTDLLAWNFFLWLSVKRSSRFIAVSEATKHDLERFYEIDPNRIDVVLHGVESGFFDIASRRGEPEKLVLCVSTLHPHKNLHRLVRVFRRFRESHPGWRLVLAGMRGFHATVVERAIEREKLRGAVTVTGWIPRDELYDLYRRAAVFVYPSTFEGFGMPVLEAMAAGVPVACSAIAPLREVGGDTVWTFQPLDQDSMLAGINEAIEGGERVARAQERARMFTWERCAQRTLQSIIAAGPQAGS